MSTLDDFLTLFIKLNTNFLLKGGKIKTSQIRNSQEGLKDGQIKMVLRKDFIISKQ